MNTVIKMATTDAERDAIYRLRYEVYVEEMQIFGTAADHERRMLFDLRKSISKIAPEQSKLRGAQVR